MPIPHLFHTDFDGWWPWVSEPLDVAPDFYPKPSESTGANPSAYLGPIDKTLIGKWYWKVKSWKINGHAKYTLSGPAGTAIAEETVTNMIVPGVGNASAPYPPTSQAMLALAQPVIYDPSFLPGPPIINVSAQYTDTGNTFFVMFNNPRAASGFVLPTARDSSQNYYIAMEATPAIAFLVVGNPDRAHVSDPVLGAFWNPGFDSVLGQTGTTAIGSVTIDGYEFPIYYDPSNVPEQITGDPDVHPDPAYTGVVNDMTFTIDINETWDT